MTATETSMLPQVLSSIWPWLLSIVVCVLLLRGIVALMQIQVQWRRIASLNRDERGGVQTLSFVLTVPLFLFILMFIVQLSQITIGQVAVEYAAFASARSAIVWIPAETGAQEPPMTVGSGMIFRRFEAYSYDNRIENFNALAYVYEGVVPAGCTDIYMIYEVVPGGAKFEKIRTAAALAVMNAAPSRAVVTSPTSASAMAFPLQTPMERATLGVAPIMETNPRFASRLNNKLTYALESTGIRITVRHKDSSAYDFSGYRREDFYPVPMHPPHEIDWQDQLVIDVVHEFALLPGPARLLARRANARPGTGVDESYAGGAEKDRIAAAISPRYDNTYIYPLYATARLTIEGFKPQQMLYQPAAATADYWTQTAPNFYSLGVPPDSNQAGDGT